MPQRLHHTIAQRADAIAKRSGLYKLTMIEPGTPRTLRWSPLLAIFAMPIGYVLFVGAADGQRMTAAGAIVGPLLLFGGFLGAMMLRFLGPRLMPRASVELDERERMVKARAGSISGWVLTVAAMAGCFYMACASAFGLWAPHTTVGWAYLAVMIEGWAFVLPVLVASWLQPADRLDQE